MVTHKKGCLVILGCVVIVFGILHLLLTDKTSSCDIDYVGPKLTFHIAGKGIHNNAALILKHSNGYANSSKGFVLSVIDSFDVHVRTKLSIKKALQNGGNTSKVMLDMLAGTLGGRFQRLNKGYRQHLPDAMIIGCKKCGTTFFNGILRKHSEVASQSNEVHFFDCVKRRDCPIRYRNMDIYRSLMMYSFADQLTMEKTPRYWVTDSAPEEIHRMNPRIKLILLVREPACRVVSDYYQEIKLGNIKNTTSFVDIMTKQMPRHNKTKEYLLRPSLYDVHMQRWLRTFPMKQIIIIKNEDLSTKHLPGILHKVEEFLGVRHELDVTVSADNTELCITNEIGERNICFAMGEEGKCKHEDQFGSYLKDIRNYLQPHVRKFEKIVNREFHWF